MLPPSRHSDEAPVTGRWSFCGVIFIVDPGDVKVEVNSGEFVLSAHKELKCGDYFWQGSAAEFRLTNASLTEPFTAVVVEWKM